MPYKSRGEMHRTIGNAGKKQKRTENCIKFGAISGIVIITIGLILYLINKYKI